MKRQEDLIEVLESLYNAFEDFRDNKFPPTSADYKQGVIDCMFAVRLAICGLKEAGRGEQKEKNQKSVRTSH